MGEERLGYLGENPHEGPWRRRGPEDLSVDGRDIRRHGAEEFIPVRTYGLRPGEDRRATSDHLSSHPRRPFAGVPVLGAMADFVGNMGDRISRPFSNRSKQADGAPRGPGRHRDNNGRASQR